MVKKMFATAAFAAVMSFGAAFAQTAAPAPATTAVPPASMARPAPRPAVVPLPAGTKVNLNTASARDLDALPSIGKARIKVIMDERAKSPFKDWADFDTRMKHTSVNAGVKAKIKDSVAF